MVLKSSKNGVYSGNTLRASNSRYNRLYRTQGSIVRRFVKHSEVRKTHTQSPTDDFAFLAFDVEFSLNKKERWGLPETLRKHIQSGNIPDEFTKTDLLVRHKLKRQANCVGYYATKGQLKRLVPRCGRYFNGKAATEFKLNPKKTRKRTEEPNDNAEETITPEDTIRYEVFIPCSPFSSIVHNPKYIKPEEADAKSARLGGGKKKKRRTRLTSRIIDEMLEFSDPRDDHILECEMQCEDSDEADENHSCRYSLRDFLKPERKPKRKSQRRLSRDSDDLECKKQRVIYFEEKPEVTSTVSKTASSLASGTVTGVPLRDPTEIHPVAVKLDANEVAFDSLQTEYGARYIEARCEPRKFSIDITDKVREHVRSSRYFRDITSSSLELRCFLSFTELGSSPNEPHLCVCNVSLNLASHMNSIKLENVIEMQFLSISDLETKAMGYINMLPRDVFVKIDIPNILNEPIMDFELVNKAKKWKVNCIHPHDFSDTTSYTATINTDALNCEFPSEFCNICYDEIFMDCELDNGRLPATCLNACGHWFCDKCWRDHLTSKLRSGARQFICPEYECSAVVDFGTLLCFLHISDIQKQVAREEGEKINCSTHAMWCPVPNCGRAILAEGAQMSSNPESVICKCGTDLCFTCKKNGHWPATCDQAKRFRQKVIALKDYANLPKDIFIDHLPDAIIVKGKSCPRCKRFIEKVSGCPNMVCPCGGNFCWTCGKLTKPYEAHECAAQDQREMVVGDDRTDGTGLKRTRLYSLALENRQMRLYLNFCRLRSRAFGISRRLAIMAGRDKNVRQQISKLTMETHNLPLQSQVCKFMMRMLSIKLELHHVIEHAAIAMDDMIYGSLRIKLQHTVSHMKSYALAIESILDGPPKGLPFVLPRLQEIQISAQRSVSGLNRLVSQIPDTMSD